MGITKPFKSVCTQEEWDEYRRKMGLPPAPKPEPKAYKNTRGGYHRSHEYKLKQAKTRRAIVREKKKANPPPKKVKPRPYRPNCKIKGKMLLQDPEFVLTCVELGTGMNRVLFMDFEMVKINLAVRRAQDTAVYALYRYTKLTHKEIGKMFGGFSMWVDRAVKRMHTLHEARIPRKRMGKVWERLRASTEPLRALRTCRPVNR